MSLQTQSCLQNCGVSAHPPGSPLDVVIKREGGREQGKILRERDRGREGQREGQRERGREGERE